MTMVTSLYRTFTRLASVWAMLALANVAQVCRADADTTRILFIGNSYINSNNLPGMVDQLAASLGEEVETMMVVPGGSTFELHSASATTQAAIAQGIWDFVVLQEQSQLPSFPPEQVATDVYPFAEVLVEQVHAANPCAEVVFMMTWGRENGDQANCAFYEPLCTYEGMQQRLRDSYVEMAVDNASSCAPIGVVWAEHRALYPTTGLYTDGSHPNALGSYIAASTLFNTVFRRSCVEASWYPAAMTADQALAIRTMASAIVADSTSTWNIGSNDPFVQFSWNIIGNGTVLFANNTSGTSSQLWEFGDGNTSTDFDPTHTYLEEGTYEVTLSVVDECGRMGIKNDEVVIVGTGIGEHGSSVPSVRFDAYTKELVVDGSRSGGLVQLIDGAGRVVLDAKVLPTDARISVAGYHGIHLWRISSMNGPTRAGKVDLP